MPFLNVMEVALAKSCFVLGAGFFPRPLHADKLIWPMTICVS